MVFSNAHRNRTVHTIAAIGGVALSLIGLYSATPAVAQATPAATRSPGTTPSPIVQSNHLVAFTLFQQIAGQPTAAAVGNFVYSPYSIQEALSLADAGARGTTDSQIRAALGVSLAQADLGSAALALRTDLLGRGNEGSPDTAATPAAAATAAANAAPARRLLIANALWGEQSFPFDPSYTQAIATHYNGALHPTGFIHNAEPSRQAINDWAAGKTDQHITDLMPPGSVTDATRLVLVNAIYFHNGWAYHPDPKLTSPAPFSLLDATQPPINVPMMLMTEGQGSPLKYMKGDHFQAVEVPYAGQFGTMLIILPDAGQFAAVEKTLDSTLFDTIEQGLSIQAVRLAMPRFTFTYGIDLRPALGKLGIGDAFDPQIADFSGMGPKGLFIQAVVHKAYIGVDENGTVAAAATGIGMGVTAVQQFTRLDIDRPFIFAIRDPQTGTILFIGQVIDPSKS